MPPNTSEATSCAPLPCWKVPLLMLPHLREARANLWRAQERFKYFPDLSLSINDGFSFHWQSEETSDEAVFAEPYLRCYLDEALLARLLSRESHWNNAEIGCHILFDRRPNKYLPDVHTLMSFFHLPRHS